MTQMSRNTVLVAFLRIAELIMQLLLFFMAYILVRMVFMQGQEPDVVACFLLIGIPVMVLYATRIFMKNGLLMFCVHVAVAVGMLLQDMMIQERIPYVIIGVVLMIYSIGLCINGQGLEAEHVSISMVSVFVIAVLVGEYMGISGVTSVAVYTGVLYATLQIVYHNANNLNEYITRNQDIANFPLDQIISINALMMLVVTALCGGILMVCYNHWLSQLIRRFVSLVGSGFRNILKAIFSFDWESGETYIPEGPMDESGIVELQEMMEENIWTVIFQMIGIILGIMLAVVAITGVIIGIVTLLLKLIRGMNSSIQNATDVKEFVLPIGMEQQFLKRREKKETQKADGLSEKVRRVYQKMILKNAKKRGEQVQNYMQPSEITNAYVTSHQEEITAIYEKARYSNQSMTKEELEQLKKYRKES